jgi:glycosyltransferase involved in cell wall biosynthesis
MRKFQPYKIQNISLDTLADLSLKEDNYYFIIWCNEVPLGHVWYKVDKGFQKQALFIGIKNTIYKAVAFYMQWDGASGWKALLEEKRFSELNRVLSAAIDNFKASNNREKIGRISVVVCTRNRPVALRKCIHSLLNNEDKNFELIVVDNAPDNEDAKKVVEQFQGVIYVLEKRKGLDIARNTGAKTASHNIVAYTDDDVQIPANWIANVKSCFADPLTMAVTGLVAPMELETEAQYVFERDWSFNRGYSPKVFNHRYFLDAMKEGVPVWEIGAGANMAFRKEVFNLVGLFDERLDVGAAGCSGDSEMWYRILAEGWNCVYFPHLYVFHEHRRSLEDLRKQLFSYMKGHVCALFIQYERYGHKGNLKRVRKTLPAYYTKRIKSELKKIVAGKFSSLLTEVKGCVAGKSYYKQYKNLEQTDRLSLPKELYNDAVVDENTTVSIIIPCYNQAHFLKDAIESVFSQTYGNIEVIVVDDGSTDGTREICDSYVGVKYVRVERVGLSAARNIGVQFSKGDFLVFLDADDLLYPNAIEKNLNFFLNYKKIAFVSGTFDKIDQNGQYLDTILAQSKSDFIYLSLLQGNYIAMEATVMYRRELFFYFSFDTQLQSCEDYDINLRISRHLPAIHHETKIAVYRMHENNMSKNVNRMLATALTVLKKQEKLLMNEEEKAAFTQGVQNWANFYSN